MKDSGYNCSTCEYYYRLECDAV